MLILPPLSLYIHFPWCIRKCPYCDFNSHTLINELPEINYINRLILDLEQNLDKIQDRPITSIFMGGGTPSLFSTNAINYLLVELSKRLEFSDSIEITFEANPGTVEYQRFYGYRQAGINRLSLGVQTFSSEKLKILGRIHDGEEAIKAIAEAKAAGFTNINIDLMHGLPGQSAIEGLQDLHRAFSLSPTHISWYQLTIEPHTEFYQRPPALPLEDTMIELQEQAEVIFTQNGYQQYEISAYSLDAYHCLHNRNYWEFGDYLGIGAGAHSKITHLKKRVISRSWKQKNPKAYLAQENHFLAEEKSILTKDLAFEFMLNALRLYQPISAELFQQRTGLSFLSIESILQKAQQQNLINYDAVSLETTAFGKRFYNNLLTLFMNN